MTWRKIYIEMENIMIFETIDIKVDYKKVGLNGDGCNPTLTSYCTSKSEEIGEKKFPALIICPGGGYDYVSDRENEPVALRFAGHGIASFVLKYSCVNKKFPTAALELASAVKYVRDNAAKYQVDRDKIFVLGFSAGGHLAASLSNFYDKDVLTKPLDAVSDDIKPNGCLLCYPVLTSDKKFTHETSILNLLGENKSSDDALKMRELMSLENRVSKATPPTFLWHTADDSAVPVENSLFYMKSLSKYKIPFEAHIYEWGNHGLSLCSYQTSTGEHHIVPVNEKWVELAINWIYRQ